MILEEFLNDNTLVRHYSNKGFKLRQIETGIIYDDPVDINPCPYTYEEVEGEQKEDETIEYMSVLQGEIDELKTEVLDTQMALCDIYEAIEGGN